MYCFKLRVRLKAARKTSRYEGGLEVFSSPLGILISNPRRHVERREQEEDNIFAKVGTSFPKSDRKREYLSFVDTHYMLLVVLGTGTAALYVRQY